ncbi:MAG TPA: acyltransferase family protein [Actinomycetes bacterium]|nr:acyltransferase family protein [Actinomycetes bacterium]
MVIRISSAASPPQPPTTGASDRLTLTGLPSAPGGRSRGLPYLPGLDGIRAIAVVAVLLFHLPAQLVPGGFLGVDVFFVLSGFLITTLLLVEVERSGRIAFGAFYRRRARRLLPALFGVLIVCTLLALTVARDAASQLREDAVAALTYTTNWWYVLDARSYFEISGRPPLLQHLWTLAIEEQFYLIWPAVFLFVWHRWGSRAVFWTALSGALASTAWMTWLAVSGNLPAFGDTARLYFGTDTHAMGILLGAALAVVWRPGQLPTRISQGARAVNGGFGVAALAALCICLMTFGEDSAVLFRGGFLLVSVVAAALIAAAAHPGGWFGPALGNPPMRWLGTRSYGIYLWHWPIFLVTRPDLDLPYRGVAAGVTSIVLTLGAAELSYRFIEMPVRSGAVARWMKSMQRRTGRAWSGWTAGIAAALSLLLVAGAALASVPTVDETTYLGGVTSVGAEPLVQPSGNTRHQGSREGSGNRSGRTAQPGSLLRQPITAVGESVMLSARDALRERLPRVTVDAAVGRFPSDVFKRIRERKHADALADVVVFQAGTNGIPDEQDLRAMLDALSGRTLVAVVNVRAPRSWIDDSNEVIDEVTRGYDNVRVVDWSSISAGHGNYFEPDGFHLTLDGARAYAAAIVDVLSEPTPESSVSPESTDGTESASSEPS